jgi:ABC-type oligopeptide transport system ATPase subunit
VPARLVLDGVEKTFQTRHGTVHALHDINLNLDDGEFVSVVGASGCGKSAAAY